MISNEQIYKKLLEHDSKFSEHDKNFQNFAERFKQIDKRFDQNDEKFKQIDKQFARNEDSHNKIVEKLFELQENHVDLTGKMAAIEDRLLTKMDQILTVVNRTNQEMAFANHRMDRMQEEIDTNTTDIKKVKKVLPESSLS